jgi:hypothetical protein
MSFLGLLGVSYAYCPVCETSVHQDYLPTDLLKDEAFEIQWTEYQCLKCGTKMSIESHGGGLFDIYPDEDTLPEDGRFYV